MIAFEEDVPVGPANPWPYSHPGNLLSSEVVNLAADPANPLPGEYTEIVKNPVGGPPCFETLYEYETTLSCPFPQDPNTVYWLKIVALVDVDPVYWEQLQTCLIGAGIDLCSFLKLPVIPQLLICDELIPLTRWGWHNRDYTIRDPYASTPPAVVPGEFLDGIFSDGTEVWHFQDDAVSGELWIDPFVNIHPDCESPRVDQWTYVEEHYQLTSPLCPGGQGIDGPPPGDTWGIDHFSKDLAFELWTIEPPLNCMQALGVDVSHPAVYAAFLAAESFFGVGAVDCWCDEYNCAGDADGATFGAARKWVTIPDLDLLSAGWLIRESLLPPASICADSDRATFGAAKKWITIPDLDILSDNWLVRETLLIHVPCPGW